MEETSGTRMVAAPQKSPDKRQHYSGTRSVGISLRDVFATDLRFEASAYALEARQAVEELYASGLPVVPVLGKDGMCKEAHNAFRFKRTYVDAEYGVPFLSSSDIIGLRPERGKYISLQREKNAQKLKVKAWDILVSRSGTVGNIGLATPRINGWALSEDVIRLTASTPIEAGFLVAFLRTQWGKAQLDGVTYGSVVQHIEPKHLEHVLVPVLPAMLKAKIGNAFVDAALKRDKANELLDMAEEQLQKTLKLPVMPVVTEGPLVSCPKLSAWRGRFDASFHSPQAFWVEQQLRKSNMPLSRLGDAHIAAIKAVTKFRKRVYVPKGGIPLLSSKQIFQIDPIGVKGLARGAHTDDLEEIALKPNYLVITRSGTIGRVFLVPEYMDGWATSEHSIRVVANDTILSGYLYAWLASYYGQALIKRYSYGSVILEIDRFMIAEIPVPFPEHGAVVHIADLVLQGSKLRDEAWQLEQGALALLKDRIQKKK